MRSIFHRLLNTHKNAISVGMGVVLASSAVFGVPNVAQARTDTTTLAAPTLATTKTDVQHPQQVVAKPQAQQQDTPLPQQAAPLDVAASPPTQVSEAQVLLPAPPEADAVIAIPSTPAERKLNKLTTQSASPDRAGALAVSFVDVAESESPDQPGERVSPLGVAFRVDANPQMKQSLQQATAAQPFKLAVDYSKLDIPFGGDFLERMTLY